MTHFFRFSFLASLAVVLVGTTGCAAQKKQQRQINAINAQIGVIADELIRIDEGLQDVRGTVQGTGGIRSQAKTPTGATVAVGSVYRTPSGFELPAISIQQALKNAGYYRGDVDGKVGSATKSAVKSFQRDHDLNSDGVVGRQTWSKLKAYLSGPVK